MYERVERDCADLLERKATVERDKQRIEAVITELDNKKKQELKRTWSKVCCD